MVSRAVFWGHIFRFSRLGWEWPCVYVDGRRRGPPAVHGSRASFPGVGPGRTRGKRRRLALRARPPRSTTIPGLGSPGLMSSPPASPGPHQGREMGELLPAGPCSVTKLYDRPRTGRVFARTTCSLFVPLAGSVVCGPHTGLELRVPTGNAAGKRGGRTMRGFRPARARCSESPNVIFRKWAGPYGEVTTETRTWRVL